MLKTVKEIKHYKPGLSCTVCGASGINRVYQGKVYCEAHFLKEKTRPSLKKLLPQRMLSQKTISRKTALPKTAPQKSAPRKAASLKRTSSKPVTRTPRRAKAAVAKPVAKPGKKLISASKSPSKAEEKKQRIRR